jgi:ketol-acid reductoisomerase
MISGPRIINRKTKKEMKAVLADIQSGKFARRWIAENKAGLPKYNKLMKADLNHKIEKVGAKLRERMPWLSDER